MVNVELVALDLKVHLVNLDRLEILVVLANLLVPEDLEIKARLVLLGTLVHLVVPESPVDLATRVFPARTLHIALVHHALHLWLIDSFNKFT